MLTFANEENTRPLRRFPRLQAEVDSFWAGLLETRARTKQSENACCGYDSSAALTIQVVYILVRCDAMAVGV